MKKLFLFLSIASLSLLSCSKKDVEQVPVAYCVSDSFNGTFAGIADPISGLANEVKITKTSCTTMTLATPEGEKKVTELAASSGNGVSGKVDGAAISLAIDGNTISIGGAYNFSGTRK
jgi:hypothetical protein